MASAYFSGQFMVELACRCMTQPVSFGLAPLTISVLVVLGSGAQEEMIRPTAKTIVARVAHVEMSRKKRMCEFPYNPARLCAPLSRPRCQPVTAARTCRPVPAAAAESNVNMTPETLFLAGCPPPIGSFDAWISLWHDEYLL
jgi:hypothetical protein